MLSSILGVSLAHPHASILKETAKQHEFNLTASRFMFGLLKDENTTGAHSASHGRARDEATSIPRGHIWRHLGVVVRRHLRGLCLVTTETIWDM